MKLTVLFMFILVVPSTNALASLLKRLMQGNLSNLSQKDAKANTPAPYQNMMMPWFGAGNGGFAGEYDDDNLMSIFNAFFPRNSNSDSTNWIKGDRGYDSSEESSGSSEESGEDWIDLGGGEDVTTRTAITTPKPNIDNYTTTAANKVTTSGSWVLVTDDGNTTTPSDDKNDDVDEDTTISTSIPVVITTEASGNNDNGTDEKTTTEGSVTIKPTTGSTDEEDNEDGKTTTTVSSTDGSLTSGPSTDSTNEEDGNDISTTTASPYSSTGAASSTTSVFTTSPGVTLYTTSTGSLTIDNLKSTEKTIDVSSTAKPSSTTTSRPVITTTIRGDTIFASLSNINRKEDTEDTETVEGRVGSFLHRESGFITDTLSNLKVNDMTHSKLGGILTPKNSPNDLKATSTNQIQNPKPQVFFKIPSAIPGASPVEIAIATAHMKEGDGWVIVPPSPNSIVLEPVQLQNEKSNTNSVIPKPVVNSHSFSTQSV